LGLVVWVNVAAKHGNNYNLTLRWRYF
jgi:hypothetical protein